MTAQQGSAKEGLMPARNAAGSHAVRRLALLGLLCGGTAQAAGLGGWTFGIAAGAAVIPDGEAGLQTRVTDDAVIVTAVEQERTNAAFEAFARYRYSPDWSVQAGYLNTGDVTARNSVLDGGSLTLDVRRHFDAERSRFSAIAGLYVALGRGSETADPLYQDSNGVGLLLGVGYNYRLNDHWQLGADLRFLKVEDWVSVPTVSLAYSL